VPDPLTDATGPGKGVATTSETNANAAALFDNTSSTAVTFAGATPWVQYGLTGPTARAQMYTLTSSSTPGDPRSWVVKGSNDAKNWTTVDTRKDQTFASRQQTRAFTIATAGIYRYYRVEVTATAGGANTSLAEVEFLTHTPQVRELAAAVEAAQRSQGISEGTARDLQVIVAAAQKAEDANDPAGVIAQVSVLQATLDTLGANKVDAATRAALNLILSQWLSPAAGLDQLRAQIGALNPQRRHPERHVQAAAGHRRGCPEGGGGEPLRPAAGAARTTADSHRRRTHHQGQPASQGHPAAPSRRAGKDAAGGQPRQDRRRPS